MVRQLHYAKTLPTTGAKTVELMPGDVALGQAGDRLRTLLGSCVSVILTDPRRTVGAMCHIVHVSRPTAANARNTTYGQPAMNHMFSRLRSVGVNPALCDAYVFGGGNMFPDLFQSRSVGNANVDWVLDFLDASGVAVVDHCLGGKGYRKVSWTVGHNAPMVENVITQ